jgi:hypothetical protein
MQAFASNVLGICFQRFVRARELLVVWLFGKIRPIQYEARVNELTDVMNRALLVVQLIFPSVQLR